MMFGGAVLRGVFAAGRYGSGSHRRRCGRKKERVEQLLSHQILWQLQSVCDCRGPVPGEIPKARRIAWQKKFSCKDVGLQFAPLVHAVIFDTLQPDGRRLRRAGKVDILAGAIIGWR